LSNLSFARELFPLALQRANSRDNLVIASVFDCLAVITDPRDATGTLGSQSIQLRYNFFYRCQWSLYLVM